MGNFLTTWPTISFFKSECVHRIQGFHGCISFHIDYRHNLPSGQRNIPCAFRHIQVEEATSLECLAENHDGEMCGGGRGESRRWTVAFQCLLH